MPPASSTRTSLSLLRPARGRPPGPTRAVLRLPNYRLFVASQVFANTGVWMQRIAQDWLVLTLTGSVTAVGITATLQFAPVALLGIFGGVLADRYSKRMLLMVTQGAAAVLAAVLAVLTFSGGIRVEHVYVIALLLGIVTAVDNPARQVFVPELVGREHLRTAVSVNSTVFQLGGLVGPAVGGAVIVAFGEGWAFAVNAVGCVVVVGMLARMRRDLLRRAPTVARAPGQLREGLGLIARTPALRWPIVLVGVVGVLALNLPVVLSAYADRVFDSGAGGFGLFNAMVAIGGVLGGVAAARHRVTRLRSLVTITAALGLTLLAGAVAPTAATFAVALVAVGAVTLLLLIAAHLLVQLGVDPAVQGRVMGVYILVQLGGRAVGGPTIGSATEALGPRAALLATGIIMIAAAAAVGLVLARSGRLQLQVRLGRDSGETMLAVTPRVPGHAHLLALRRRPPSRRPGGPVGRRRPGVRPRAHAAR